MPAAATIVVDAAMLAASLLKHVQNRNSLATLGVDIRYGCTTIYDLM